MDSQRSSSSKKVAILPSSLQKRRPKTPTNVPKMKARKYLENLIVNEKGTALRNIDNGDLADVLSPRQFLPKDVFDQRPSVVSTFTVATDAAPQSQPRTRRSRHDRKTSNLLDSQTEKSNETTKTRRSRADRNYDTNNKPVKRISIDLTSEFKNQMKNKNFANPYLSLSLTNP